MPGTIIADRRVSGKKIDDKLSRIKSNVKDSHDYFSANYKRFHKFKNLIYNTSLSSDDVDLNKELGRPQIEFNLMEAKLNKAIGEFAKQEPGIYISNSDLSLEPGNPQLIETLEGYFRNLFYESNRDNMAVSVYGDMMDGGFSAIKIYTDYINEMSFDQQIMMKHPFDPTLCGWDKMATESHKGDGMFCFELYPVLKEEFESQYGTKYTSKIRFTRSGDTANFNWSYVNNNQEILMRCHYWEKKKSTAKIVRLVDGSVMTETDYEEMGAEWENIFAIPTVVGKPRLTDIVKICRYDMIENYILEYAETDYKFLPLIFADGNSKLLRNEQGTGSAQQMTRPAMYNMMGLQKLKNFVGIMIANHIENTPQSQWLVPVESIPAEYKEPWIRPQTASTLFYNAYKDNDPTVPLPPPREVMQPQMPPGFLETFGALDGLSQTILGSFDSAMGMDTNQLSGKAIYNSALMANAAASPYLIGYIRALNRAAEIILDLIPKYIKEPRSLSIRSANGKNIQQIVNTPGNLSLNYDPLSLKVKVEAGINFELQRQQALETMTVLMDKVPPIGQFITTEEEGIEMLLDNVEIRGIDALKTKIKAFIQKINQQQQMAMQSQQMQMQQQAQQGQQAQQQMQMQAQQQQAQMDMQMQIEQMRLSIKAQAEELHAQIAGAKLQIEQYKAETARIEVIEKADESAAKAMLKHDELHQEAARTAVDVVNSEIDRTHKQTMDMLNLHQKENKNDISNL